MPEKPTRREVADIAAKVDWAQPGMKGICLRGQPGWGQVLAPLSTVVSTFGGTWFTEDWQPAVNAPEFTEATQFHVDLGRKHGENGAPQAGFTECLNNMTRGKVARCTTRRPPPARWRRRTPPSPARSATRRRRS